MVKKGLFLTIFMVMGLNAVVKSTKILDLEYQLDASKAQKKTFINNTGVKILFRYRIVNPKTGSFMTQEPICLPGKEIVFDLAELGKKVLPAGYGKVFMSYEVAKVLLTPHKKMDELSACRFKNGKKDLLISNYELDSNDTFELYLHSHGSIGCKPVKDILRK